MSNQPTIDRAHLEDLIAEAEEGNAIGQQPERAYREEATKEYECAGFDMESVPFKAIALRAFELQEANDALTS